MTTHSAENDHCRAKRLALARKLESAAEDMGNDVDYLLELLSDALGEEDAFSGDDERALWAVAQWCQETNGLPDLSEYETGEEVAMGAQAWRPRQPLNSGLSIAWRTVDGRRQRLRFEPATGSDHPEAAYFRMHEAWHDREGWLPVGADDVAQLSITDTTRHDTTSHADRWPSGADVYTGP